MQQSPFAKVAEAVKLSPEAVLRDAGIVHKSGAGFTLRGEWTDGFICALACGDTSGSASFTRELYLHCHQCGTKKDLFDWLSTRNGTDAWTECKRVAALLNVNLATKKIAAGRSMPKRMTNDILAAAVHDLLESDLASHARAFLRDRNLLAPRALAELGIGFIKGYIVFAQFAADGSVLERFRGYVPGGEPPWRWFGVGTGGPGVWPAQRHPADSDKILLLEGEWDVLTALVRLRFHRQGWTPCTFTSGAGAHPPQQVIPKWFVGREVHVAYDNDTWQGPEYHNYVAVAKPGRKLDNAVKAMQARRANLVERIVPMLEELGATPVLRQCPIPASQKWGADLRDWVDAGGRDFNEWPECRNIPPLRGELEEVPFDEAFDRIGQRIRTTTQVNTISEDDVIIPSQATLVCDMGSSAICAICPAVRLYPDKIVDLTRHPEDTARSLYPGADRNYILKQVIKPPRGCPGATITCEGGTARSGSLWYGIRPNTNLEDEANRSMLMVSDEPPSLTGVVEVTGTVHYMPDFNRAFMRVEKIRSLDRVDIDLRPVLVDLLSRTPHAEHRVEEVDEYFTERWRDFTANVTRIHGRREVLIAHDLLMHSVSEIRLQRDTPQRGWLDIAVFGNTRSGKTATFEAMMKYHGLGLIHSAVSNVSRAGLVMGTDTKGMLRPGLFPRCHRKALVLDEWHYLVRSCRNSGSPAAWIQTARDSGYSDSAKISGNRKLPTRVRFATISNWTEGSRHNHQYDCEHLLDLYDTPEAIARLDFAIAVNEAPSQPSIDAQPQFWTADLTRMLILRAWMMTADHVEFEPGAYGVAKDQIPLWTGRYDTESIPLFTIEEKALSIMRIATACANVCFSHPEGRPMHCLVRTSHVRWAIQWLEWTWINNGYESFSAAETRREAIVNLFTAERLLTVGLMLDDPSSVENMLGDFFAGFTANDLTTLTGKDINEGGRWLASARKANVFKVARNVRGDRHKRYVLTRAGTELVQAIIRTADEDPEHYMQRYRSLASWFSQDTATAKPAGLEEINGVGRGTVPF